MNDSRGSNGVSVSTASRSVHAEAGPAAAEKGTPCVDPHSSANHEADLVGDFGLDDAFDDAEFTLVQSKRKKPVCHSSSVCSAPRL